MGWLSKIFEGSSHGTAHGRYRGRSNHDESFSGDESEDLDHAIALSLLEEEQRNANASEISVDEDEQLARALQESLNAESPPRQSIESSPRESKESSSQESIESSSQESIESPPQQNIESPPRQEESSQPKCYVCNEYDNNIEYVQHPFWKQTFCPSHVSDGTPRCFSCERLEARDTTYLTLDYGRKLCLECFSSAVMDTDECQPLYLDIQEFFIGLNMTVDPEIPLLLVDREALYEAREGEKEGKHPRPKYVGICLTEEQTVSTIRQPPRFGSQSEVIEIITEPYTLTRQFDVTAILVLYGQPRLHTGTILAHEMMHAWLTLQDYRLSRTVEEGICQVLAHMWIKSEIMSGSEGSSSSSTYFKKSSRSQFESKLAEFIKQQIEEDSSPIYGDGFRNGNEAVIKYGLKATLDHIKLNENFPC